MVVRASKQQQQAVQKRNWRIGTYSTLALTCAVFIGWLLSWYQQATVQLDAVQARLDEPPVYIHLGKQKLFAPPHSYSDPSHLWFMTNKSNPITPHNFSPNDLVALPLPTQPQLTGELVTIRRKVATALTQLDDAAQKDGIQLMINSAYRSYATQRELLAEVSSSLYDTGARTAPAGASEHQLGLAIDFSSNTSGCRATGNCTITPSDAAWLAQYAHRHGFILRYPEGREDVTGYEYEPWHFRYVGRGLATALHQENLTLDEAWPALQKAENELRARGEL